MMKRLLILIATLTAVLAPAPLSAQVVNATRININGTWVLSGSGSPEGSVVGAPGDVYISTNGSVYAKASGSGTDNSGWVALGGGGSGTVTSVGLTLPGIFSVSGTPVTTSGTIAASLVNQSANRVWAGPSSGAAAAPAFRQIVFGDWASNSCTTGQIPKYDGAAWVCDDDAGASSGAPNAAQYLTLATDATLTNERVLTAGDGIAFTDGGAGSTLTVDVDASTVTAGTLPVANGGTNLTAAADDNVMVGNGTTWQTKAIGDCDDSGGNHLNYDTGTNAFSCGTSSSGGGGSGAVVQVVRAEDSTLFTENNGFSNHGGGPFIGDDTLPQSSEGSPWAALDTTITPTDAANKLRIQVKVHGSINCGEWIIAALYKDSDADALDADGTYNGVSTAGQIVTLDHWMTAGTTSAITFKVRVGSFFSCGTLVTFNGAAGARLFGGAMKSTVTVSEIVP